VRAYQYRVFGFGVNFLGDRTEAEEVTPEVLLRLWQHRKTVDDDRLLGWLLRLTRNAYIDVLRQQEELTARLQAVFDL
jgi:DNA-directed RNA polymerase specialized sigma24 family protein